LRTSGEAIAAYVKALEADGLEAPADYLEAMLVAV
jgi:hypothetical protein